MASPRSGRTNGNIFQLAERVGLDEASLNPIFKVVSRALSQKYKTRTLGFLFLCGEGGIRTHDTGITPYKSLANSPVQPCSGTSPIVFYFTFKIFLSQLEFKRIFCYFESVEVDPQPAPVVQWIEH